VIIIATYIAFVKHCRFSQSHLSDSTADDTGTILFCTYIATCYACQYILADTEEIPYHTKFLLIASFLASYNLAKTDKRYFSEVCIEHLYISLCRLYSTYFTCSKKKRR